MCCKQKGSFACVRNINQTKATLWMHGQSMPLGFPPKPMPTVWRIQPASRILSKSFLGHFGPTLGSWDLQDFSHPPLSHSFPSLCWWCPNTPPPNSQDPNTSSSNSFYACFCCMTFHMQVGGRDGLLCKIMAMALELLVKIQLYNTGQKNCIISLIKMSDMMPWGGGGKGCIKRLKKWLVSGLEKEDDVKVIGCISSLNKNGWYASLRRG